ncbi:MAG: T9SS type A sorting domain-containing protein [Chitinophagales bacterium]|nr:T9SS type A sorting domain-containing protein [Chitinophagales bacterium]
MKKLYLYLSATCMFCFFTPSVFATVYDVNSLDVSNTGSGTSGTLRYCISQANQSAGPHVINFSVAGTISITNNSALPSLNQSITIDASTAPGYAGTPVVILDGSNSNSGNGINIAAANCAIYGLQISGFAYNGISVSGNNQDYFRIGAAGKGNVIISNGYRGIQIDAADNGMIAYNHIGVEASGDVCAGNGYDGIDFSNTANNDSIYFNHISCNEYNGIQVGGCDGIVIKGNVIGPLSNSCAGNLYRGIDLEDGADNCIVGGSSPAEFNKIAGNLYWGIEVKNNSINNLLSGNSYLCNDYGAIEINAGGNNNMQTPVIASASGSVISGTSSANAVIEIFKSQNTLNNQCTSTPGNQGADFIGTTTADATGNWSISGSFGGYVIATSRDANGNTSEFSTEVNTGVIDSLMNKCEGTIQSLIAGFTPSSLEICQKNCLDFTDQSTNAVSWQWYFEGGTPAESTAQNPASICYNNPGVYEVLQVAYGAGGDSAISTITITVNATPPIPTVTLQNDTLFSTSAFSYQWFFNGDSIPGANDSYYAVTENGFYYVTVQDSNGCVSGSLATQVIIEGISTPITAPSIYAETLNGNSTVNITFASSPEEPYALRIFDLSGRMLFIESFRCGGGIITKHITLPSCPRGIYFVELASSNRLSVSKIILQ